LPAPPAVGRIALDPLATCIVALAQQYGQVTPRLLVEQLRVSKPTATRHLRDLSAQGVLAVHGKGRATCYSAPAAPPATGALLADLAALDAALASEDDLAALYVGPPGADRLDIVAAFGRLPDVLTFLALEQRLADALGRAIKLRPLESVDAAAPGELQAMWVGGKREGAEGPH
jgi:hypothetical protein